MKKKEFVYVVVDSTKRKDFGIVAVARSNYQAKKSFKGREGSHSVVRVRLYDVEKPNRKQKPKTVINPI